MAKHIILIANITAIIMSLAACSGIDYNGEYSKDGFYNSENQVYFNFKEASDSIITYSFGVKVADTLTHTVYVPVTLAGKTKDQEQTFKVVVDGTSTAKEGVHFTALNSVYSIPANAMTAYVPVELLRKNLSGTQNDSIRLVLRIDSSSDLGTRFTQKNKVTIAFDNLLLRPDFWDIFESYWGIGTYTKAKYTRLLSYYNGDPQEIEKALNDANLQGALYMHVVEVINYFTQHPDENV